MYKYFLVVCSVALVCITWLAPNTATTVHAAFIDVTCNNVAVRNSFNNIIGWEIRVSISASPATEPYSVNGGGSASSLGRPNVSGNNSYTVSVNGPTLPPYSVTARFLNINGGDSCSNGGASAPNPPTPAPNPTPPAPPPPQVTCPNPTTALVQFTKSSIQISETTTVVAPSGWSGGTFISKNPGVASIGNTTGPSSADVLGASAGIATIAGAGWRAPNGANPCLLGDNYVTVTNGFSGSITTSPVNICPPGITGATNVFVQANTYTDVLVYGAQGISDGTLFAGVPANTPTNLPTGQWVKNGTWFKLIAPYNGNQELGRSTITITSNNCVNPTPPPTPAPPAGPTPPPPTPNPPPPAPPKVPWAAVFNTQTVPAQYGPVTCGKLLAVWQNVGDANNTDGFRIYNTALDKFIEIKNSTLTQFEFDPKDFGIANPDSAYPYAVASFRGALESQRTPAGSASPILSCDSDLSPSNKDITQVRDIPLTYYPNNQTADAVFTADSLPVRDGDNVEFAINVVNGGYKSFNSEITVVDTMFNLHIPGGTVNASVLCNNECDLVKKDYNANNRVITFKIVPKAGGSLDHDEAWTILFTARTIAPTGTTASIYKFQNRASVNNFTASWLETPYIPVLRDNGVPSIYETR